MSKEQARAFVERWQIVDRHIVEEIRNLSPEERARQIAAAYQTGRAMNLTLDEVPFQQWQRLKEKLNGW